MSVKGTRSKDMGKRGKSMWAEKSVMYQIYPLGLCGAPFENGYWVQYYKAELKLATFFLANADIKKAEGHFFRAKNSYVLKHDVRCQYIFSILAAFLFKEVMPIFEWEITGSYYTIMESGKHNYKQSKAVIYHKGMNEKDCFYLDPRVW